jgi:hypothetical protein
MRYSLDILLWNNCSKNDEGQINKFLLQKMIIDVFSAFSCLVLSLFFIYIPLSISL